MHRFNVVTERALQLLLKQTCEFVADGDKRAKFNLSYISKISRNSHMRQPFTCHLTTSISVALDNH
jgi:hypothetical protein